MHSIPSAAEKAAASKIAQTAHSGKARICFLLFALLCLWAFASAARGVAAKDWKTGRAAWKEGNYSAALRAWSRNGWAQPFAARPARLCYWKIRALEKLGRDGEARCAASLLSLHEPLDFYSFVLAYEGRYPVLTRAVDRAESSAAPARRFETETAAAAAAVGVRESVLFAIMERESKFRPEAVSARGAVGLMQLMPATAREAASRLKAPSLSHLVPEENIMLGAAHFAYLHAKFRRRLPLSVAAYNAGAAAVAGWNAAEAADWVEWIEDIPYPETREYVRAVLENIELYDFAGKETARGRGSFFAWAALPPSLGDEFSGRRTDSDNME